LAARVLKIANSAMFSRQREITTISQAVMIIGFKALKGIAIAATLRQMSSDSSGIQKLVWENSVCTAMCATAIARKLKKSYIDEIFLLGLLHNLGQIVLLAKPDSAKKYAEVIKRIDSFGDDYVTAEQAILGFSHALIGALVAKKWNFSDETCQVILHYKDPIDPPIRSQLDEKTAIIQLAEMLAHAVGSGNPEGYPDQRNDLIELAKLVGFDKDTVIENIDKLIEVIQEQFLAEKHAYE
ncbi:MAG: HDOD domain-containing protein, partial [SAR324 cluster bacterium]|nr:HDOD domain-containing protein [SAR324 cluster bacterium]